MDTLNLSSRCVKLRQPDDWHLHLRDGFILKKVVAHSARTFRRAIVMPNLSPPIKSIEKAKAYRKRILDAVPDEMIFDPLMTVYLTDDLRSEVVREGFLDGIFTAAKLYPMNTTTNSMEGVSDIKLLDSIFETMEEIGMPLLIHGEVNDPNVDIFDREEVFIERHLEPLRIRFPELKIVLEHITTKQAIQFVETAGKNVAATITPHHLHINRNAMFEGGLRSDFYCLPVAKREIHRLALRKAATSGSKCFFLGTDSAPHTRDKKINACGCAGIFNSPFALESYAKVFEEEDALDHLEAFASINGPTFYGLPVNEKFISLVKTAQKIPFAYPIGSDPNNKDSIIPFHAGETLNWSVLV